MEGAATDTEVVIMVDYYLPVVLFAGGEEEEDPHHVHRLPAGGAGAVLRARALSGRIRQGGIGAKALSQRGKGAGTAISAFLLLWW